jgi:phage terminase large subunit
MPSLSNPQNIYLNGLNTKYRAYVGGFGSGKTFVGCLDLLIFASQHPGTVQGYFGPSYPSIRDIFYPTLEEAAHMLGFTVDIKEANKEAHLYRNGCYYGTIICRSMDRPDSIIGFKIARALVDEIDTLAKDKAKRAWNKIIARLRLVIDGVENGVGVTTTPEGFLFVYETFALEPKDSYSMVQASSYENAQYLPPDYIDSLRETYSEELIQAYLLGNFINLTSGTVYSSYDRIKHRSKEMIEEGEPLHIGMDFNVSNMSAVVYVHRGREWHAAAELKGIYDTPSMIKSINNKWPKHSKKVYPDASGSSRKTVDASISDIALLEEAGYSVYANKSNPLIKDRIISTNQAFTKGFLYINDIECPEYARCMEQLAYDKNGEPDKRSNLDHLPDAGTYPIAYSMPVVKPAHNVPIRFAR